MNQAKALVVDDLEENRISFAAVLRNEKFSVDLAASANEALSLLLKNHYFCILCDVQMPEIDGIEFAKIVRKDADISGIPIIFITAHDYAPDTLNAAFGVDAYDFIRKPVDPLVLSSKLRVFYTLEQQKQKIETQAKKLEEINSELDQFARIASHDLKAPLRAISGIANIIAEDYKEELPEGVLTDLEKLRGRVTRMNTMLVDLLEYSQAGREAGQLALFSFSELVNSIVEVLDIPSGFSVDITYGTSLNIKTYKTPLTVCIRNLISNAIKHHHKDSGRIELSCKEAGTHLHISVKDDGPGIDAKYHEKIFEVFKTLQSRDKVEGSGVGLSIIKRTLDSINGKISLKSELNKGAEFTIHWPLSMDVS